VAEVVRQMDALIKTGKLRHWGILNWSPGQIREAWQVAVAEGLKPPCAAQLSYSLLDRSPVEDEETRQILGVAGVAIVASYSLYGGLLTGKYNRDAAAGRFGAKDIEKMRQKGLLQRVDKYIGLAQELGCTPAQLALAYCLKNEQVASVLVGATKVSQVEEDIHALKILPLIDREMMARVRS
jgi:aryl-alcohol dehydrogenase-like predicted oxidoreductase